MPANPIWYRRLPEIKEALRRLEQPLLDRAGIEKLFRVRKRQAVEMMKSMDAEVVGGAFVVSRSRVAAFVSEGRRARAAWIDQVRRTRLTEAIEEARRDLAARAVRVPVSPTLRAATLTTLPETIQLRKGELRIAFRDAGELLQQLFALSQAIGRDFPTFEALLRADSPAAERPTAEPGLGHETGYARGGRALQTAPPRRS